MTHDGSPYRDTHGRDMFGDRRETRLRCMRYSQLFLAISRRQDLPTAPTSMFLARLPPSARYLAPAVLPRCARPCSLRHAMGFARMFRAGIRTIDDAMPCNTLLNLTPWHYAA